ncbi:HalOD1 output domain-containing protein [Natronorubrum sp. A-ect3]|uniref:HalOD1 output domain-containing protein n=1 Tax=Natronorubrum sp. A-ect3 TaxID=3242698 RepID=UPI00359D9921
MTPPQQPSSAELGAPTQRITEAVAAHEGVDVTAIEPPAYEPLYTVIDPEALDALFRTSSPHSETTARVILEYAGYEVVVHADGHVEVSELSPTETQHTDCRLKRDTPTAD